MTEPPTATSPEDVVDVVIDVVAEFLGLAAEEVPSDAHLRDLGADSIDRVEILVTLKRRLGVSTPLASFARVRDLVELAELLAVEKEEMPQ